MQTPNIQRDRAKNLFIAEVAPSRHIMEFSMSLANTPGTLNDVTDILAKHNVNILTGFHDRDHWSFFADVTKSDIKPEQLEQEIVALERVGEIRTLDEPNGIIVDTLHYPVKWGDNRAIILRARTLSSMLDSIRNAFGAEGAVARILLHTMGEAAGRAMFEACAVHPGDKLHEGIYHIIGVYTATGWGIFNLKLFDPTNAKAIVQAVDNFECSPYAGSGSFHSHFVRGHLAGLFSQVFNRRMEATETACVARGDSICEFKIEPAQVKS